MKRLEQWLVRTRAVARSARTALPGRARQHRPVRLVLRLNDIGLAPGLVRSTGQPLGLGAWQEAIVRFTQWLGPVRVAVSGGEPAESPLLEPLVKFANRLECPTHVVTSGLITRDDAEALVDAGLGAATVLVGGVDGATHEQAIGRPLDDAASTLDNLRRVRQGRSRRMDLLVGVPLSAQNLSSLPAIGGWARQAGADGVLATLPLGVDAPPGAAAAVSGLGRDNRTPDHLLEWLAGRQTRPHGGLRAELLSDGTLLVSACTGPLGNLRGADPKDLWEASDEQIRAARQHPRPWDEVELVPEHLESRR